MSAVLVEVAEAVAKLINDNLPDSSYTTQRPDPSYCPEAVAGYADFDLPLEKADELQIDVIQATLTDELDTRGSSHYLASVDIGLRYKFKQNEAEAETGRIDKSIVNDLSALTQLFLELFKQEEFRRLPDYESATWNKNEIRTIAPGNYLRKRQFLAIIRVSYDVDQDL